MIYLAYALIVSVCVAAGTALVYTEHYAWAWIPFLMVLIVGMTEKRG